MKIRADKIDNGPQHGLSRQDVRLILATVPPKWIEGLVEVRLASSPGPRAYLFRGEGRLTIYSRYATKRQVLTEILSALAAPSLNITNVVARSPSKPEQHRIDVFIRPILEKLLTELTSRISNEVA
jgi:protein subunit release factor A